MDAKDRAALDAIRAWYDPRGRRDPLGMTDALRACLAVEGRHPRVEGEERCPVCGPIRALWGHALSAEERDAPDGD